MTKNKIYVVEDDPALQELYTYSLEEEFLCVCFDDASSLYLALKKDTPNLIILDIMLPGDDGFTILNHLKTDRTTSSIPVIMVSAKDSEIVKVKSLNMGADDYMSKPFGVLELIARIKANIRKYTDSLGETFIYKDISIDHSAHTITVCGNEVPMTLKEYNLLTMLTENAHRVNDREAIFARVWGESFIGETRTLDVHIKDLRRKLKENNSEVEIQTIRGVGYLLS